MAKERKTTLDKAIDVVDVRLKALNAEHAAAEKRYEAARDALYGTIDALQAQRSSRRPRKPKTVSVVAVPSPALDRKTAAAGN